MSSHLVLATTDQETGIREPTPPAQGHTAGPGVESRAAWPAKPYSFFWPTRLSWGQGLLETRKEWARLCLCLAERRNQLPTLRPTASSSQPDQRPTGFSCSFLPWPLGSLTRHAHSHHHHHHHQGRAAAPGTAQGAWGTQGALCCCLGSAEAVSLIAWPRLVLRFICIPSALPGRWWGRRLGACGGWGGWGGRNAAGDLLGPLSRVPTRMLGYFLALTAFTGC